MHRPVSILLVRVKYGNGSAAVGRHAVDSFVISKFTEIYGVRGDMDISVVSVSKHHQTASVDIDPAKGGIAV